MRADSLAFYRQPKNGNTLSPDRPFQASAHEPMSGVVPPRCAEITRSICRRLIDRREVEPAATDMTRVLNCQHIVSRRVTLTGWI